MAAPYPYSEAPPLPRYVEKTNSAGDVEVSIAVA